jgi:hypothetical protein
MGQNRVNVSPGERDNKNIIWAYNRVKYGGSEC